ncbi:MAG: RagB/SusD family nutrient uptake outer membrane protein [Bacteroidota bacterium]
MFKRLPWHTLLAGLVTALLVVSCDIVEIDDKPDPNGPSLEGLLQDATADELANVVTGIESGMRNDLNLYYVDVNVIGREMYRFLSAEPRFTGELLGKDNAVLDDNTFYTTRPWGARYRVVRNSNILIEAANASTQISDEQRQGVLGYAKTMQAYQLLLNLNLTYNNGIRIDVAGDEPGPVVGYSNALEQLSGLLDEAYTHLGNAGSSFAFSLSEGFSDFNSPTTFGLFNRAIKARIEIYRGEAQNALDALDNSFLNESGDIYFGAYHNFSTAGGDQINPVYENPDAPSGDSWLAHPSFIEDSISSDDIRLNKAFERTSSVTFDGLTSGYGFYLYKSQVDPIPVIRNEELILIKAEALINRNTGTDLADAETLINYIRNQAGLPDYGGATTQSALLDEMLLQRRYSLYGEGHRWIDMRRYDRLDELPIDRANDDVWEQFPIPRDENVN